MKVLVIGAGGREHALAWRLIQGASVSEVLVVPGNAGTAREPGVRNVACDPNDFVALVELVRREGVELTIVGPEVPLVAGIRDAFDAHDLPCFGPSAAAAQLEGSKSFAKDFMARHRIPTGSYATFSELQAALDYVQAGPIPVVIKADGLAAGKGVVVASTLAQAQDALTDMLSANRFGAAGARVVVEEFLPGEEASFICLCDGTNAIAFATSQDHKARDDGDTGPNTGGMGAYSPAPVITPELHARVMREIIEPTLAGMAADGISYQGFLYAGLMIKADGSPYVIEFNCRLGDPETQPLLLRLKSDLAQLCVQALRGELKSAELEFDERAALGVVMAAGGYPGSYPTGELIAGLAAPAANEESAKVFHAGTADSLAGVVTAGGRVLCVCALGDTVAEAQQLAYRGVEQIQWDGAYWRRDIGYRAVQRSTNR